MERFCKILREHATKIINYGKKEEIMPLTDEENKSYRKLKVCYICKKEFSTDDDNALIGIAFNEVAPNKNYQSK